MEYTTAKEKLNIMNIAFDGCKEQPVDVDLNLPDYCPDVRRVLKCRINPQIGSKSINGDNLEVDGNAVVTVLYTDAQTGAVRCYEHIHPFNVSFTLKEQPTDYIIFTKTKIEYVNCRALTPRKLDLHGAFNLCVRVITKGEKISVTAIEGDDIEQKFLTSKYSSLMGIGQQLAVIKESIPMPSGKPEIQSILRKDINVIIDEVKLIPNKAMIKGDIQSKILYLADIEKGTTETFDFTIPFNQIVEAQGCDESCSYSVGTEVNGLVVSGVSESNGENSLNFDAKITFSAMMFKDYEFKTVMDLYSHDYDLQSKVSTMLLSKNISEVRETIIAKASFEFTDKQLVSVTDLWCDNINLKPEIIDSKAVIKGRMNVNILAIDNENEIFFTERSVEINYPLSVAADRNITGDIYAVPINLSYRINGNSNIEFRGDIKVNLLLFEEQRIEYISEAYADENEPIQKDEASMVLYYSKKGEQIWDIAKKYKTSVSSIKEENELISDISDGELLMLLL